MPRRVDGRQLAGGLVGVAVAAALLAWAFDRAGMASVTSAMHRLSLSALVPAVVLEAAVQASKALKWWALLQPLGPVRYRSALSAVAVGAASTHLVPLRLDEVLRAAVLGRREGLPAATVLGTVAVDRVIEVFVAGLLLGGLAITTGLPPWMRAGAAALWIGFAVVVGGLVVFVRSEEAVGRWLSARLPAGERIASLLGSLADGIRAFPRDRWGVVVLVGSAGEWLATLGFYVWMLRVFEVAGPPQLPVVMSLGNAVAYAVPNVPGALGTYEALQATVLENLAHLSQAEALGLALAAHSVLIIPVTAVGLLVGLWEWRRPANEAP